MRNLAPIILFVFNRADHASQTIEALKKNNLAKESELFIFCDGPRNEREIKKVEAVHKIIDNVDGFKNVTVEKLALNRGLANSVISGVKKIIEKYGRVIVLEDDIVTAPNFLEFMNDALDFYEKDQEVFSVTGFNYHDFKLKNYSDDIFYVEGRTCSWGWSTWEDRWNKVDFLVKDYNEIKQNKKIQKEFCAKGNNLFQILKDQMESKIDTWDIQFCYHMFKAKKYCIFPIKTLVKNIGFDSTGIHCHSDNSMTNFEFGKQDIKLINLDQIKNNTIAEEKYIKIVNGSNFEKIFSKKKILRLKYILIGFLIAKIFDLIF